MFSVCIKLNNREKKMVIKSIGKLIMVEPMNGYSQSLKWVKAVVLVNSQTFSLKLG
jgi:hypothetical protein